MFTYGNECVLTTFTMGIHGTENENKIYTTHEICMGGGVGLAQASLLQDKL